MPLFAQGDDRVAAARPRAEKILREKFTAAGLTYPASELFLRAFKREGILELWARNKSGEKFVLVHAYTVAKASGGPGPKRKEGDGQVPEGFYTIDRFNPKSLFHLSLGLNYPNAADRVHSDKERPGGDIFIHGSNLSIGCLAMTDPIIEEIYLAALDSKARPIRVHLFPARMNAEDWPAWRDEQLKAWPTLAAHWEQLQPGFDHFEKHRMVPAVQVDKAGLYRCQPGK
jgi:murein L,D-transpeptidase YafK